MKFSNKTVQALASSLKFRQMRQELIASNVANAETPGYKAKRLSFEKALARAIDVDGQNQLITGDPRHHDVGGGGFENLQPEVYDDPNGIVSPDGNTVDRDYEMSVLAENTILYNASVKLLNKKIGLMNYAISSD